LLNQIILKVKCHLTSDCIDIEKGNIFTNNNIDDSGFAVTAPFYKAKATNRNLAILETAHNKEYFERTKSIAEAVNIDIKPIRNFGGYAFNDELNQAQRVNETVSTILNNKGVINYNGKEYRIDDYEGVEGSLQRENGENRIHKQEIDRESGQRGYDTSSQNRESNANNSDVLANNGLDKNKPQFSKDIENIRDEQLLSSYLNLNEEELLNLSNSYEVARAINHSITLNINRTIC